MFYCFFLVFFLKIIGLLLCLCIDFLFFVFDLCCMSFNQFEFFVYVCVFIIFIFIILFCVILFIMLLCSLCCLELPKWNKQKWCMSGLCLLFVIFVNWFNMHFLFVLRNNSEIFNIFAHCVACIFKYHVFVWAAYHVFV